MTDFARLHIVYNAADALARDFRFTPRQPATPEQIAAHLGRQAGHLFRLAGWCAEPPCEVTLRITGVDGDAVAVENCTEPPFSGTYAVAGDPPPFVTQHGDHHYELVRIDTQLPA